jgi:HNH endonuclease
MAKSLFPTDIRERVMLRAFHCCEYCKSQDKYSPHFFTIDHILALSMGGTDEIANLAYACFLCNRLKSNKLMVFDQITEKWVPLFNPRTHIWNDHFLWNEDTTLILGTTSIGRSTITTLKLNREKLIAYRNALLPFGEHPPR